MRLSELTAALQGQYKGLSNHGISGIIAGGFLMSISNEREYTIIDLAVKIFVKMETGMSGERMNVKIEPANDKVREVVDCFAKTFEKPLVVVFDQQ